jgi:hypothetical protein
VGDGLKGQVALFEDQVHGAVKTFLHGDIGLAAQAHRLLLLDLVETIAMPDREVILDLPLDLDGEDGGEIMTRQESLVDVNRLSGIHREATIMLRDVNLP